MRRPEEEERKRIQETDGANRVGARSSNRKGGKLYKFERDMAAGAVMGGVVHTVVAPIERVKLLLQTQEGNAALISASGSGIQRRRFKGFVDCVLRTVREEGFISLWRGNGTGVLRYYPSVALNFSLKVRASLSFLIIWKCSVNAIRCQHCCKSHFNEIFALKDEQSCLFVL
jgi:solute carrier family 25 (mitochondrial adenine nucleotide translocator), member 4/5/6/31